MAFVYSCCFWFSLRLGAILIGIFSVVQAVVLLIACCYAHTHKKQVQEQIMDWTNTLELVYLQHILESVETGDVMLSKTLGPIYFNPERYSSLAITVTSLYIFVCLLFIYGAYSCKNTMMIAYLCMEITRLILLSVLIANLLLLLKQNTMDIGLLIGASIAGGFLLLGMFYLWVCAVNLPILVNEMELDENTATINKLKQLLESNNQRSFVDGADHVPYAADFGTGRNAMFASPRVRATDRH